MQEKMQALQLEKQRLEDELRKVTHMVSKHISEKSTALKISVTFCHLSHLVTISLCLLVTVQAYVLKPLALV